MKVLIVSSLYAPYIGGGAEIIIQEHAAALRKIGVEVAVLSIGPQSGLVKDEVDGVAVWRAGIRNVYFHHGENRPPGWKRSVWHLRDIYNPFMKPYVRQAVQEFKPDIASCHNITGWSVAAWDALTECRVPIVQVLHDQYLLCPKSTMFRDHAPCPRQCFSCRLMRLPHAAKSNQVRAVVGVSQFVVNKLLDFGYFKKTPIKECIHNIRDFPFDPAAMPSRKDDGNVVFGFIGTLAPNKGIELLLDSFTRCAQPEWRLLVAGTGGSEYEAMLKGRYADERITFLGRCAQADFFTGVDITITPSLWEDTFPTVVFESMLFGVPVIGSRRGGIPEMIVPGKTGLLFTPGHSDSLLEAMHKLADKIDHFRSSRDAIIRHASPFRDQKGWTERWYRLYQRALSDNASLESRSLKLS
ncbi:MAG TPA: glycosyltransferase family 4 protein [Geobacteraceae bacterium]